MSKRIPLTVTTYLHDVCGVVSARLERGLVVLLIERSFLHLFMKFRFMFGRNLFMPKGRLYLEMKVEDYICFLTLTCHEKEELVKTPEAGSCDA